MGHPPSIWHVWGRRTGQTLLGVLPLVGMPLALLVIFLGTVTSSQAQTKAAFDAFDSGNAACSRNGEYKEAEARFRTAVSLSPNFMAAWNNLGVALLQAGAL